MQNRRHRFDRRLPRRLGLRGGAGLLVVLFVLLMTTGVVVAVLETEMLQMTALRHTIDYERARYLAEAAAAHALAELEADGAWRAGVPSTEFPAGSGHTFSATVVDASGGTVVVTAQGTAGGTTRKVAYTVELGD